MTLPGGVVTFCFTDIEGSTRLARRLGPAWPAVLERHHAVLRSAWAANRGVEVRTEGDAFFVAFDDAERAVAAAVDVQRELAAATWPPDVDIRVRIGLHSGEAELGGGDYVGIDVHKAARVVAAAHGGQVLLSAATAALVGEGLPAGATLRDLGVFRLKDFDDGERLLRLEHPDLAGDGRAPRAAPVEAHNLPVLRTRFVGRDVERVEVAKLCSTHRVVTIVGPGGAGKTRIALEVARTLVNEHPDGVWAVLLAGETPGADIVPTVARALGVADLPDTPLLDAVVQGMDGRQALVILDNCEHVLASAAAVADALAAVPEVTVLATSRQALGVADEQVWSMPGLGVPAERDTTWVQVREAESAELFAERAAAVNPRFRASDANAAVIATICRVVEGMPLAVELAAAASRAVPLETLAARLAESNDLLRSRNPTDVQRQRSIDELIGWSYDALDDVQAAVFRRLAVFRGGWTVDGAEAVCAGGGVDPGDVLPALADLAERSLVNIDADDRYRMLVLIRQFATTRLDAAGERAATEAAHSAHFLAVAEQLHELGQGVEAMRIADREMDNFRAAFDRAVIAGGGSSAHQLWQAFSPTLFHGGHWATYMSLLAALAGAVEPGTREHLEVGIDRLYLVLDRGNVDEGLALGRAIVAEARALGDPEAVARAVLLQAWATLLNGNPGGAVELAEDALAEDLSPTARAQLLEALAAARGETGDEAGALEARVEAGDLWVACGYELRAAGVRLHTAAGLCRRGDIQPAVAVIRDALRFADEADVPRLRAHALVCGSELRRLGGPEVAAALGPEMADVDEAVDLVAALGEAGLAAATHIERALVRVRAGDMDGAAADLLTLGPFVESGRQLSAIAHGVAAAALVVAARGGPSGPALAAFATASSSVDDPVLDPRLRDLAAAHAGEPPGDDEALELFLAALAPSDGGDG